LKKSQILEVIVLVATIGTVIIAYASDVYKSNQFVKKLQSGEVRIECSFKEDGLKLIAPSKIVSFDQDTHTAIFTNGYSKSCEVVK
jgi:hypothetical protein